jgi:hypothetical protein
VHRARRRRDAERLADDHGGQLERHIDERLGERMSGCAYYALPHMARVRAGTSYLVTLKVPQDLDALPYPVTLQYHHGGVVMSTAPRVQLHDWRQEFVHLVGHEAFHTHQFREGLPKSEVAAERWALQAVLRLPERP